MVYQMASKGLDLEWHAEFVEMMRDGRLSELATAIFRPFRRHGIVFGTVPLYMLKQFGERILYELEPMSYQDLRQRVQVTLRRNWRNTVYIHYRAREKKTMDWGYYLYEMKQGRLERFDESEEVGI